WHPEHQAPFRQRSALPCAILRQVEMTHLEEVEAWRAARYRRLTAPDGWLALVGKHPLARGENAVDLPAGAARVDLDGARARVRIGGAEHVVTASDAAHLGDLHLELFVRGEAAYLRVKDASAPARREFKGIPHYPVDVGWRFDARFLAREGTQELDIEGGAP